MASVSQTEGYTTYAHHVKCSKWFCKGVPVYKKMIIKFPCIVRYVPRCVKHK